MLIFYRFGDLILSPYLIENFDKISGALMLIGIIFTFFKRKKKSKVPKQTPEQKQKNKPLRKYSKWYPSGWVFNEETQLWEPPDYLSKESKEKWEWDEEKRIWIDKEKDRK